MLAAAVAQVHSNGGPDNINNASRSQRQAFPAAVAQQRFATLARRTTTVLSVALFELPVLATRTHVFDKSLSPPSQLHPFPAQHMDPLRPVILLPRASGVIAVPLQIETHLSQLSHAPLSPAGRGSL